MAEISGQAGMPGVTDASETKAGSPAVNGPIAAGIVLETGRLILRPLDPARDAVFILELLNDPGFLRYIGDKKVRTLDDARGYIENGPAAMIAKHGFGLWLVQGRENGVPLGLCGLLKRETLPDVDIGYAFLPAHCGQGYAVEAAAATLAHGRRQFGLRRIVAITTPDNESSAKLLRRIGMRLEDSITLAGDATLLNLFAVDFADGHD